MEQYIFLIKSLEFLLIFSKRIPRWYFFANLSLFGSNFVLKAFNRMKKSVGLVGNCALKPLRTNLLCRAPGRPSGETAEAEVWVVPAPHPPEEEVTLPGDGCFRCWVCSLVHMTGLIISTGEATI